jgi:1-aminocyclopropane-1-carboxylate deaminase
MLDVNTIQIQRLKCDWWKNIEVNVLRLDELHPIVSGNKWFKLKYYLQEAKAAGKKCIATFGGAYSNHIVATAFACKEYRLKSIGIIRGEKPPQLSASLQEALHYGMELKYVSREA